MNIFFLDWSPRVAAEWHCDKHVVKMIIESAQILYCAHWMIDPEHVPSFAYKKCHVNHPCTIWARQSLYNYMWLCSLGLWLCREYTFRYGKTHKTEFHLNWLFEHIPIGIPNIGLLPPAQAMPSEYKDVDPIKAYQSFYIESKHKQRGIVKYSKRDPPPFIQSYIQ